MKTARRRPASSEPAAAAPEAKGGKKIGSRTPVPQYETPDDVPVPPTKAVYDRHAVLREIEMLLGRRYYRHLEEFHGSPTAFNEADQSRYDRLLALYHDARAGQRPLLIATQEHVTALGLVRTRCPGFEPVVDLIIRSAVLSMRTGTPIAVPAIMLLGPPGVGKTHSSRQIAAALDTDIHAINCAVNSDAQALVVGHPTSWKSARMGQLTEALANGTTAQPVILLDEADKLVTHQSEKPYNTLLTVLEPENSRALVDEFVRVPFDLSGAIFIATANDIGALPDFIVDRLVTFFIAPQRGDALLAVTRLIAEGIVGELQGGVAVPSVDVLTRAARHNPRRLGNLLRLAFGYAAAGGRAALTIADIVAAEELVTVSPQARPIGFLAAHCEEGPDRTL